MTPTRKNIWLPLFDPVPGASARLFCFPYAGGSAQVYRTWHQPLQPACEVCAVQPPGRWNRHREPPVSDLAVLVDSAIRGFSHDLGDRFALFGHSVGALVAFEFARGLRARGLPEPEHLFVSGRRAPHIRVAEPAIETLSDYALIALVSERYGGIPEQVLRDRDMLAMAIPLLRADLRLDQGYVHEPQPPLSCPITMFHGSHDLTTSGFNLAAWREHTTAGFEIHTLPGGHFFIEKERDAVLNTMKSSWLEPREQAGLGSN